MTVGLYHPEFWNNHGHWNYRYQTPANKGFWKGIDYRINDRKLTEADFIVVHENLDRSIKKRCRANGVILVTGEEKTVRTYHPDYLAQFDLVITSRDDIKHPNVIRTHYFHPWRVKKTYDELAEETTIAKEKKLSSIISNLATLPIQKLRLTFMEELKQQFGDSLDWFSKGGSSYLVDKWDGLERYRYSVAIENSVHENYFTEKITDCFLAQTMPIYFGCPNITSYFDERSLLRIDLNDFSKSIQRIKDAIDTKLYETNLPYVRESKRLVLTKYHFIAALSEVLYKQKGPLHKLQRVIRPERYFKQSPARQLLDKVLGN